jgi:hypothetical protein
MDLNQLAILTIGDLELERRKLLIRIAELEREAEERRGQDGADRQTDS